MALGVLRAAQARGIAIPADLAVVGFDGLDEGAHFSPTLTTVVQPLRELGELAVREAASRASAGRATVRRLTLATWPPSWWSARALRRPRCARTAAPTVRRRSPADSRR